MKYKLTLGQSYQKFIRVEVEADSIDEAVSIAQDSSCDMGMYDADWDSADLEGLDSWSVDEDGNIHE